MARAADCPMLDACEYRDEDKNLSRQRIKRIIIWRASGARTQVNGILENCHKTAPMQSSAMIAAIAAWRTAGNQPYRGATEIRQTATRGGITVNNMKRRATLAGGGDGCSVTERNTQFESIAAGTSKTKRRPVMTKNAINKGTDKRLAGGKVYFGSTRPTKLSAMITKPTPR